MEPIYFQPNRTWLVVLILAYIVSILSYYFYIDVKDQCILYLLAVTLPASFTALFITMTRQVVITDHTITLRKFGRTLTASFYKIKSIEYRKSFWRGGLYMCITYTDQYGVLEKMKIGGDYNITMISDVVERGRKVM